MTVSFHNAPLVTETIRTTNAVATELLRWVPELDSASIVRLTVNGTATSGDVVSVVRTWSVIRSDAGTVIAALSAERRFDSGSAAWVVNLAVDGGDGISAVCSVTGQAAHDVTWTGVAVALNGSRSIVRYWSELCTRFQAGEYVDCGDNLDLPRADPFSIAFWFRTTQDGSGFGGRFFGKHAGGGTGGYVCGLSGTGAPWFYLQDDGGTTIEISWPSGGFNDGQWHLMIVTYDGSSAAAGFTMYLDNSPGGTTAYGPLTQPTVNAAALKLGAFLSYYYNGDLDDVAFYSAELSGPEATWIWNGGEPRDPADVGGPAGLRAHWRMGDEDTFPTVTDYGPSGFHGTCTGMEGDEFVAR